MKVILSSGVGRLHFIESAKALKAAGVDFELICGYVPQPSHRRILDWLGPLMGRANLGERLAVRLGPGGLLQLHLRGNALAEALAQVALRLSNLGLLPHSRAQRWAWRFFGWRSCRYLRDQAIFHVRSGAGQGGAIREAKRRGMTTIVDHSIAHPAYTERVLAAVHRTHGTVFDLGPSDPFWQLVLDDCREADFILVNSDFVKRTFREAGFDAEQIAVNYLGVREDFYGLKHDYTASARIRLLFTGSFELRKGADVLTAALAHLNRDGLRFELHVAGDARKGLRSLGRELAGLPIVWHGSLLQDDLKDLLRTCDLYVFPSYAEGSARSAMEALFAGIPVIATEATGLPGTPGVHYRAVESGDAEALATAVRELADDIDQRRALGNAGIALAATKEYTWPAYGRRLKSLYERVSSQGGTALLS